MITIRKENLSIAQKIAGEIILSENSGNVMKKWRKFFHLSQIDIAEYLHISPSVISDYESGRRKSPGKEIIKRFIEALLKIDELHGECIIRPLRRVIEDNKLINIIIDILDFIVPVDFKFFCQTIKCNILREEAKFGVVKGYIIIDYSNMLYSLSFHSLNKLFEASLSRVLILTNLRSGKSIHLLLKDIKKYPQLIVLHNFTELNISQFKKKSLGILVSTMHLSELIHALRTLNNKIV